MPKRYKFNATGNEADSLINGDWAVLQRTLGARQTGTPANMLNCNISIVQAWNRALTPTEVSQNFNAYKSRFGL